MAKQTIKQRVERIRSDYVKNPATDLRKRWQKVVEDGIAEEVTSALGPMPVATLDDIPLKVAIDYAGRDADATLRIDPILDRMLDEVGLREVYEMDMAIVPMIDRMQHVGMKVNIGYFSDLALHLTDMMKLKVEEINISTGGKSGLDFNPGSSVQTAQLLFERGGVGLKSRKKTKMGKDSTNDKVLEALSVKSPVARLICDYRELAKLRDSFCNVLPQYADETGRVHPNFRITRVSSGRLSCTEPNLLAIPVRTELGKLIREGFIATGERILGSWDLDQIEMREMAHQSQDPVMIKWFNDGLDVHRMTGAAAFGCRPEDVTSVQRYASKRLGFGIITGITEMGLAEQMALAGAEGWDEITCAKFIGEYFKIMRGVKKYLDDCRAEARRYGFVRDRWGRIRYLPGVHSELSWVREEALRQSHSFKISASAQGILKYAMKAIWDWWKQEKVLGMVEPLLQIHDELVVELDSEPNFIEYMDDGMIHFLCNTTKLCVPIKAKGSTGINWGVLKD